MTSTTATTISQRRGRNRNSSHHDDNEDDSSSTMTTSTSTTTAASGSAQNYAGPVDVDTGTAVLYDGYQDNKDSFLEDALAMPSASSTTTLIDGQQQGIFLSLPAVETATTVPSSNERRGRLRLRRLTAVPFACTLCWAATVLILLVIVTGISLAYLPLLPQALSSFTTAHNVTAASLDRMSSDLAAARQERDEIMVTLKEQDITIRKMAEENEKLLRAVNRNGRDILNNTNNHELVIADAVNSTIHNSILSELLSSKDKDDKIAFLEARNKDLEEELDAVANQRDSFWDTLLEYAKQIDETADRLSSFYCFMCR